MERNLRKKRLGRIISDKMDETIAVAIKTKVRHLLYGKTVNRTTKFKAHDENNETRLGNRVPTVETRPSSEDKGWRLVGIVERTR